MSVPDSLKINGHLHSFHIQIDSGKNSANLHFEIITESNGPMAFTVEAGRSMPFFLACHILELEFSNPNDDFDTRRWIQLTLNDFIGKAGKEIKKHRLAAEKQKLEDQIQELD